MATFNAPIDASFSGDTLTFSGIQGGSQLGTGAATISALAGGVYKATGTVDLSSGSAGDVDVVLADASGNVAWFDTVRIDDAGALVDEYGTTASTLGTPSGASISADIAAVNTSGTVTAEDLDPRYTFRFPRAGSNTAASNRITLGQNAALDIGFDIGGLIPSDTTVASVGSVTVSDSGATVGAIRLHTSRRKFLVPLTDVDTTGTYTATATFTTADSQTLVVTGTLVVV